MAPGRRGQHVRGVKSHAATVRMRTSSEPVSAENTEDLVDPLMLITVCHLLGRLREMLKSISPPASYFFF